MRFALLLTSSALLAGCAAPAPDLPRHVSRVNETGFQARERASGKKPVAQKVWLALTPQEQKQVLDSTRVDIVADDAYGIIIDVQSDDQSTGATHGGAALGATTGQAAYLDHALRGGNYSAATQIAAAVAGAAIGSTMDSKAASRFQHRYTIKLGNDEIQYFDETRANRFRHTAGVCVSLPDVELTSQKLCNQTREALLAEGVGR